MPSPAVTVVIPTKNRREDLRRALASVFSQSVPVEVLVHDDAATDGTSEMVRAEFPAVSLTRGEQSRGPIPAMNEMIRRASAPIVMNMDDDAELMSPTTLEEALRDFDHPRVAVVGLPFIDVRISPTKRQFAPEQNGVFATHHYVGCAGLVRRDVFVQLGGFRDTLRQMVWESEYCLRALSRGYVTRLGRASTPVHHYLSPVRSVTTWDVSARRGDVLMAWWHAPAAALVPHLAMTVVNGLRHGARVGRMGNQVRGLAAGFRDIGRIEPPRSPLPMATYKLWRELRRKPFMRLEEFEGRLPPIETNP